MFAIGNRFDQDKSLNGVWCVYDGDEAVLDVPEDERPQFLIARMDAPEVRRALLQERERMMRAKSGKDLTGVEQNELLTRHLALNVLKGWRNVYDADSGAEMDYNAGTARELIEQDGKFRAWLDAKSGDAALYYRERVGNSARRSNSA